LRDLNTLINPSLGWVLLGAHDINDAGQIVGYGFNNFTGLTHAVRLRPAVDPPPVCTFNCLRSTRIVLRAGLGRQGLKGLVSVNDENGTPVAEALVLATWTSRMAASTASTHRRVPVVSPPSAPTAPRAATP
jgi:hypothetical protein